jgi:flagellum-specific peptidoglycan hydrolase FlgJ
VKEVEGWNPKKQVFGKIVVTKEEMMKIVPDMIVEEILTGVPALGAITIAQWKIESKCGHSVLAKQTNNLYGIKHVPKWDASPETWMKEFRAGYKIAKDDKPNDKFIRFKSQWACIRFHTKFLTILRYKKHIGKDYKGWATGLRTSGYATDKSYTDHLLKCYKELDLAYIEKLGYKMRKWKNY